MASLKLTVNLDSDAFWEEVDSGGGDRPVAVTRLNHEAVAEMLRGVVDDIENGGFGTSTIRDANGNPRGTYTLREED